MTHKVERGARAGAQSEKMRGRASRAAIFLCAATVLWLTIGAATPDSGQPARGTQQAVTNGVLSWLHRTLTGYQQSKTSIYGAGPLPVSLPLSDPTPLFAGARVLWSPDGNSALIEREEGFGHSDIWLWRVGAGAPVRIIDQNADRAAWSPNGTQFAYMVYDPSNSAGAQIWIANADGSNQHVVTTDPCGKFGLAWGRTPSGERIAFGGGCPLLHISSRLLTVRPDGSDLRGENVLRSENVPFDQIRWLDWSPDGAGKLLFQSWSPALPRMCKYGDCRAVQDFFLFDTVAGTVKNLTNTTTWEGPYETQPVWSPDGTKIAYTAYSMSADEQGQVRATRGAIWLMNADGSNPRVITQKFPNEQPYGTYEANPSWQPCVIGTTRACSASELGKLVGTTGTTPTPPTPTPPTPTPTTPTAPTTPAPRSCSEHITLVVDASREFHEPEDHDCWNVIRTKTYDVVETGIPTQHCHYTPHHPSRGAYWGWDEVTIATKRAWPSQCKLAVEKLTGNTDTPGIFYYGLDHGGWLTGFERSSVRYRLLELYGRDHVFSKPAEKRWMAMNRQKYGAILAITSPDSLPKIVDAFTRLCNSTPDEGAVGWWAGKGSAEVTPDSALYEQLVAALDDCTTK